MPKSFSRKFISPIYSKENGEFKENSSRKLGKTVPFSLSDSQYEELFFKVLNKSAWKNKDSYSDLEEDNVVIPEPDAALSPVEEAEKMNRDVFSYGSPILTKTPKNPIDNSNLPPLKKKKSESRIKKLGLKLKPTRLNFDDVELKGKSENESKLRENETFILRTSKISRKSKAFVVKGNVDVQKFLPEKESSKSQAFPSTIKENTEIIVNPIVSNNFQSQQTVTDKRLEQMKKIPGDDIIPSSNNSLDIDVRSLSHSQSIPKTLQLRRKCYSTESKTLSPRSKLFRLQEKRNVGLWIQCSNHICSKWRYSAYICDPTEVPDKWQCYMNDDERFATCEVPEYGPTPLEEEDLIHNIYTAGSLVWAHLSGYPWWPAMVDDDPDVEQYYWITEYCDIPTHYNVSFFDGKPVSRAWLTPNALTKYMNNQERKVLFKMTANGIDYSSRIKVAIEQANEAAKLPIAERLKKFGFISRYKGPIGKKTQLKCSTRMKRKKIEREKEMSVSLDDSQANVLRSLEVVKEVNEVLSQITSDSESEEPEENTQIDLNKSQEEVSEVLNTISDSESVEKYKKDKERSVRGLRKHNARWPLCKDEWSEDNKKSEKVSRDRYHRVKGNETFALEIFRNGQSENCRKEFQLSKRHVGHQESEQNGHIKDLKVRKEKKNSIIVETNKKEVLNKSPYNVEQITPEKMEDECNLDRITLTNKKDNLKVDTMYDVHRNKKNTIKKDRAKRMGKSFGGSKIENKKSNCCEKTDAAKRNWPRKSDQQLSKNERYKKRGSSKVMGVLDAEELDTKESEGTDKCLIERANEEEMVKGYVLTDNEESLDAIIFDGKQSGCREAMDEIFSKNSKHSDGRTSADIFKEENSDDEVSSEKYGDCDE